MGKDERSPEARPSASRLGLAAVATIAVAVPSLVWMRAGAIKPAPAPQTVSAIPVQTATITPQAVEITQTALGTVAPWNTVTVTPQVSGQVLDIPFEEGSLVHVGDVLVRIDPRPFQAILDQSKARKAQDDANLNAAQKNLARDEALLAKGGFATQQTIDNEEAQVEADKAMIANDQAGIESARLNLDFATIKAPFTGVVGLRNVDAGNIVAPSANIVTITQIEPIAVEFTLPQSELSEVQSAAAQGKPPVLAFDQDGKDLLARGSLEVINNEIDPNSGTIKLKARFDNKDHRLWPGAFVQVRVVTRSEPNAVTVPSQAVQRGPEGPYVWLVPSDQTAWRQPVDLGQIQGDRTIVASGLSAGDRIVVAGQYRLTQGARVSEPGPAPVVQAQVGQP
jgi:multidrug efflux system membrane fusion protein